MYEIVWQVQTDLPAVARKSCQGGDGNFYGCYTYEEILAGFANPEVIDLGEKLVIWQTLSTGVLAAEGWRRLVNQDVLRA